MQSSGLKYTNRMKKKEIFAFLNIVYTASFVFFTRSFVVKCLLYKISIRHSRRKEIESRI